MATTRGIDVSAYQGTQDWAAHKKTGVTFAFAKASEGERSRDGQFDTHISGIIKASLVPGAYHFGWPTQNPATEAVNYIGAVKPYASATAGFVHWLDLERYSDGRNYAGRSATQIKAWVTAWLTAVQKAFPGQRVGVYTSGSDLAVGHIPAGVPLWYPAYPWGAAAYTKAEAAAQPKPSGRAPLFWQFTSQPLDRSIAYLSAADLRTWAAGTSIATEKDTEMELKDKVNLTVTGDDGKKALLWAGRLIDGKSEITVNYALACAAGSLFYGRETLTPALKTLGAKVDAQNAAITALAQALAARDSAIDIDALVQRITTAIENITVHLDTTPTATGE
jgi:GH25 family lysozyme M1 (1,4-beta-N-acetylmuramidase)